MRMQELRQKHEKEWQEVYQWLIKDNEAQESRWRWEFIRRSPLYREHCEKYLNDQNPDLIQILFWWGLPRSKKIRELFLDYEEDFFPLVTALTLTEALSDLDGKLSKDWRTSERDMLNMLARHDDGLTLPPMAVTIKPDVSIQENGRRYVMSLQVKVNIPPGDKNHSHFMNEISKNPPANCHELTWSEKDIILKLAPEKAGPCWPPWGVQFSEEQVDSIISAAYQAYGDPLPGVAPWTDRAKTRHYSSQLLALDVKAGLISKKDSGLDAKHYSRTLKTAQDKLSRLEEIAKARQKAFVSTN